jgi:superfamily I DNA/RNA helicase
VRVRPDRTAIDAAFAGAWRDTGATGLLGESAQDSHYWKDEIAHVIKGRGLTSFEQYAGLARAGRRYRLTLEQRRAVWDLRIDYDERLRAAAVHDWADQILLTERELISRPLTDRYAAVVVDEAQDLSAAMVRMLYQLVGDRDDGLLLVGDGQQSIYPGGYTLAEIGVDIAGRGVVLDLNYRNTTQILDFASRVVVGDEYTDIEGVVRPGELPRSADRDGPQPVVARCSSDAERDQRMVDRIRSALREVGTAPGDLGVLCQTLHGVDRSVRALQEAGLPVIKLTEYDGGSSDGIKVGTIKRAKGLEFKQVLLPDVRRDAVAPAPAAEGADRERWTLLRRELYVGMTRARDGLWLGLRSDDGR